MRYKVTLDTNLLDKDKLSIIQKVVVGKSIEIVVVSVTEREIRGTNIKLPFVQILETGVWDESEWGSSVWGGSLNETFVLGESQLGNAVLGSDKIADLLEELLKVITNGSFPKRGNRDSLTPGQKRILRDAMILEAHCREKCDIFVSNDKKAFIGKDGELRKKLESLCSTKILTFDEFLKWLANVPEVGRK